MCLDRGLQGQGSARPGPTPLMATPWARTASAHSIDHNTMKTQYRGAQNDTKLTFTESAQLAGSARSVRSRPCSCDTVSLNLENDLYDKSSSPKSSLSSSSLFCPIKKTKRLLVQMAHLFPVVHHSPNQQRDHNKVMEHCIMHTQRQ